MPRYSPYEEYINSGVEWLDVIPAHWNLSKVKYLAPFQVGWTPPTKNDENFNGSNIWVNISDLKAKVITSSEKKISDKAAKEASMSITPQGSLMYSFKLSVGAVSFAGCDMYTNEAIASFLENDHLPLSYLYYALPKFVIENASTNIYGAKILNQELIKNALLLAPPYDEAELIANFLNHETAKIDTLIEKQQQLITLLKEKRQAVISHAVTKGLNPDAPMKDSGVEWLGQVPENWTFSQLGYCAFVTKLTGFEYTNVWQTEEDGEVIALRGFNIKERKLDLKNVEKISSKLSKKLGRSKLSKGDIVFPCTGTIGNAALIEIDDQFHINQNIAKIRFDSSVHPRFAIYWLTSSYVRTTIDRNNSSGMQPVVLIGDIRKLPFPKMGFQEQEHIANFLDLSITRMDYLISKALDGIELMEERRTALISAAVTGKIDVRNWKPTDNKNTEEGEVTI
ncbi:restriction endonuclease subunit S [Alteromonas macleodii]|uniref:restriction endonuclease subunit S n=1 Tax=Alteromonas macleodii TaxID=28108 RepID=UPI00313BBF7B